MSTITKQWLQQKIADMEATRDDIPFGLGEDGTNTLAALRIALASLEAEPVMNEIVIPEPATHRNINEICPPGVNQTLFASGWNASRKSGMNSGRIPPIVKGIDAECMGWNACRDAMLQSFGNSEQLNSPVIQDGWVACSERLPTKQDGTVFLTWNGQYIGKELFLMGSFQCLKPEIITHWMPLPTPPQK